MDEKKLKKLQIISFSFIGSVLIYIPALFVFDRVMHLTRIFQNNPTNVEKYSFYASAFLILLVIALKKFIYFPSKIVYKTIDEATSYWMTMDIILMSIGSSIGMIGLLAFLLGASYFRSMLLIIISILVMMTLFPFKMRYDLRLQQLKEMKRERGIFNEPQE